MIVIVSVSEIVIMSVIRTMTDRNWGDRDRDRDRGCDRDGDRDHGR